jgi:hypothetical protein
MANGVLSTVSRRSCHLGRETLHLLPPSTPTKPVSQLARYSVSPRRLQSLSPTFAPCSMSNVMPFDLTNSMLLPFCYSILRAHGVSFSQVLDCFSQKTAGQKPFSKGRFQANSMCSGDNAVYGVSTYISGDLLRYHTRPSHLNFSHRNK